MRLGWVTGDWEKVLALMWSLRWEPSAVTYGPAVIKSQSPCPQPSVSVQLITLSIRCHRLFVRIQKQINNGWGCHLFIKVRQMKPWLLTSSACCEPGPCPPKAPVAPFPFQAWKRQLTCTISIPKVRPYHSCNALILHSSAGSPPSPQSMTHTQCASQT